MNADHWMRIKQILDHVEAMAPNDRSAYLSQLEATEPQIAAEIRQMLQEEDQERMVPDVLPGSLAREVMQKHQVGTTPADATRSNAVQCHSGKDAPPENRDDPQATPFGDYRLHRLIGEGVKTKVYLASHHQAQQWLALKKPKPEQENLHNLQESFRQEATVAAKLQHPNICPVYDQGEVNGIPYLTMPFLEGEPLSHQLARKEPWPITQVVSLIHRLALAIQYAHDQGVVHPALQPGKIFLTQEEPILLGYGSNPHDPTTGPLAYCAPEQLDGARPMLDPFCNIYSLGVILYELLTGAPPDRSDHQATTELHSSRSREIPDQLEHICLKAMESEPKNRWPSMNRFAEALTPFLTELGLSETIDLPKGNPPLLTLRIRSTPWVYRPASGQLVIRAGRQRRKPDAPSEGNDFVLRVSDNEELSKCISRYHFEIYQTGAEYHLVDISRHGVLLNGNPIEKKVPIALSHGDILKIARVIELEVLLQSKPLKGETRPRIQMPTNHGKEKGQLELEASIGDMITLD